MKNKLLLVLGIILIGFTISACFGDACGLFGATSTYSTEFVLDKQFRPLEVSVGDTIIFRPETHAHVNYFYTGSSSCDGEDYKDAPYFDIDVEHDSIAVADEFYDYESDPLWRGTELKIRIIGKEVGSTKLNLDAEWYQESTTDDIIHNRIFEIELDVLPIK